MQVDGRDETGACTVTVGAEDETEGVGCLGSDQGDRAHVLLR